MSECVSVCERDTHRHSDRHNTLSMRVRVCVCVCERVCVCLAELGAGVVLD